MTTPIAVTAMPVIRQLTREELNIYSGAVVKSTQLIPAFRDAVTLLKPFYDGSAQTAYTDQYARVGLSKWFFEELDVYQAASVILHEAMHVLNDHFKRGQHMGAKPAQSNISGDLEINSILDTVPRTDLSFGLMPDRDPFDFAPKLSMEQYHRLLKDYFQDQEADPSDADGDGDGAASGSGSGESNSDERNDGSGSGSGESDSDGQDGQGGGSGTGNSDEKGNGSNKSKNPGENRSCDNNTDARSASADEANIERAGDSEVTIAKKNTVARMVDQLKNSTGAGSNPQDEFLRIMQQRMDPPKVSWRTVFRKVMANSTDAMTRGRVEYTYRRTNRRTGDSPYIFPGLVQYIPKCMLAIDTSGSMAQDDYMSFLNEAEGIIKTVSKSKDALSVFPVDVSVKKISPVGRISDINLQGGGGTAMDVGVRYVNELPRKKRPDIFILATDGFTDWTPYARELRDSNRAYTHVLLITNAEGYQTVTPEVRSLCTVIDVSRTKE